MALELIRDGDWVTLRRVLNYVAARLNQPLPQARVFNSANISIVTSGTPQFLTFDSERFDNGGLHSTSVNTGRLTAPITGLYMIGGGVEFAVSGIGSRQLALRVNGTTFIATENQSAVAGDVTEMDIATPYRMTAGDYVELRAFQNSGGALNVTAAANYSPEFWMYRVGGFVNEGI